MKKNRLVLILLALLITFTSITVFTKIRDRVNIVSEYGENYDTEMLCYAGRVFRNK